MQGLRTYPPPPTFPPPRPKLPPAPEDSHALSNDVFFNTSDELQPVPVLPTVPRPEPVRDDPLPKHDYRQPGGAVDRRFVYKPGPTRTDVQERLGLDGDSQGSLGTSIQLLAVGQQNYVLDINPQMSFFKAVYRRHTNAAIECFEDDLAVSFGRTTTFNVPRRAHMLGDMLLEIRLPNLGIAGGTWADAIGYVLMARAKLIIDDTVLHDHERLWYDMVDKLYIPHGRRQAIDAMIGRGKQLATDRSHTIFLPFKFLCCKNQYRTQQFIPLVALSTRSELTLEFTAETLEACVVLPAGASLPATAALAAKLLTEQIFVEEQERRAAMMRTTHLMIDTVQDVDALSYTFDDEGRYDVASAALDMSELNLPVKAVAFVAYDENATAKRRYFQYLDCVDQAVMYLNSTQRFAPRSGDYFSLVQTYTHAARCAPDYIHLYSFALECHERQPSGALNFAVVDRPSLRIDLKNTSGRVVKLKAFAHCINWLVCDKGSMAFVFQT